MQVTKGTPYTIKVGAGGAGGSGSGGDGKAGKDSKFGELVAARAIIIIIVIIIIINFNINIIIIISIIIIITAQFGRHSNVLLFPLTLVIGIVIVSIIRQ